MKTEKNDRTNTKALTEEELIEAAFNLFRDKKVFGDVLAYDRVICRTQVEISGCIADGLLFISDPPLPSRIIGLEAKTNKDNYSRLYEQVNAYLSICDEVYLIIQDKSPPLELPFYVGIIQIQVKSELEARITRYATSLKHTINAGECWVTLLKAFNTHCRIPKKSDTLAFFNAVENIKRKLIWNQFVIGFHQTYVKDYIPLSAEEKRIVRAYFGESYQILLGEAI